MLYAKCSKNSSLNGSLFSDNSTYQGDSTAFNFIAKECLSWLKEAAVHPLDVANICLVCV